MQNIRKTGEGQKLFKYYIDKNIKAESKESMYFTRLNRYHFNSYNNRQSNRY